MEENRSRQNPSPDFGVSDEETTDEAMADEAMADDATADDDSSDRGYELDLDKHSPTDLDAVIQDAVQAVERAGRSDAGGDGGTDQLAGEPGADAEQLRSELADLQERLLRTMADFDNFRKRTEREKEALRRTGAADVLRDFLSVGDNLERALESSGGVEDLKQGLQMILRQLEELLRRHGVEKVESVGRPFDPTLHEAVATRHSSEAEVPMVTEELQRGYLFHDRLLRPAMVWVTMPAAAPEQRESEAEAAEAAGAEDAEEVGAADLEESDRVMG